MSSASIHGIGRGLSPEFHQAKGPRPTPADSAETPKVGKARGYGQLGGHGPDKLFKQVQRAVAEALRQLPGDGSGGDVRQVIEDAIAGVVGGGGTDTEATPSVPETPAEVPTESTPTTDMLEESPTDMPATSEVTSEAETPAVPEEAVADARDGFFQSLKQHGITPQQFKLDLLAAVELARWGAGEDEVTAAALQSLPPGSAVDVAA